MFLLKESEIKGILKEAGVAVSYETENDFVCLCPFHWNRNSPSMTISKSKGVFNCFSPSCGAHGDIVKLLIKLSGKSFYDVARYLESKEMSIDDFVDDIVSSTEQEEELRLFDQSVIDATKAAFPGSDGEAYMYRRGFTDSTLDYFDIGYSQSDKMVTVPIHSYNGEPMGMIGRAIEGKRFKNTNGMQGSKTLWNIHRAKRHGDTVIITEASFDAMKVHQAGHPNVVALVKGALSKAQATILERSFNSVVVFVDNDNPLDYHCEKCVPFCHGHPPGAELSRKIYNRLGPTMTVYKVPFSLYHGKDAGDMTEDQINRAIRGAEFYALDMEA